ncbi:MAG: VOC family protein [Clostridia bacterium]|nr:VOC family protein [Clostridia bacterium]
MITKVRSVGICVSDQQRALEFYTKVLGCEVVSNEPMGDAPGSPRWIEVRFPGDDTRLILFTPPGMENRIGTFTNVILVCDDMQKTYEELSAKGVEFTAKPERMPWGWWASFKDPDGNEFGLGLASED